MRSTGMFVALLGLLLMACSQDDQQRRFKLIPSRESGVTFRNNLTESVEFNIFNYLYFYNGGGVAAGDVNGDKLLDLYFTSNQGPNKLYLNTGNFKFRDVTDQAGVAGFDGWTTGVTMADVNGDGKMDIYVSNLGDYRIYKGKNQLFINKGDGPDGVPQFVDEALEYGLDLVGFSTQAAFFDYDLDGDLDMFMLNHSVHQNGTFGKSEMRSLSHPLAGDKLMRNDNGKFTDVAKESGIYNSALGYGLGVVVSDVNMDGFPDIYVGNDFHENDYLYINQGNGKFKEVLEQSMNHTSRFTMGCDFADFNNDGFPDLIAMDMLPEDPKILKASAAEDVYDVYNFKLNFGYNHQFARNTLQMNQHDGTFSEIALLAGVSATDWSWSALFGDFDLDGRKDIFISNGIERRSNDLDYINFVSIDSIQNKIEFDLTGKELTYVRKMPQIKLANYMYRSNGDSTFLDVSKSWGFDKISYSNGSAYADLDNDGDLDLVINNLEDEAFVYENTTVRRDVRTDSTRCNFVTVELEGNGGNTFGIGTKVILYNGKGLQLQECMPTRGYESSVDYRLSFGLGAASSIDSIRAIWPDGSYQTLFSVKANQFVKMKQTEASGKFNYAEFHKEKPIFRPVTEAAGLNFKHEENKFNEFTREALLPHMLSAEGPKAAIADVNGDKLEDIFVGGAKWQAPGLFLQTPTGNFVRSFQRVFSRDSVEEDVDALFVDVDSDNDKDLVVVSGGNEFMDTSRYLKPRLYLNDGKGRFSRSPGLPNIYLTGSTVSGSDMDHDGDVDLFIGARTVPWKYGIKPDSYLLENDGHGNFKDVTDEKAPALRGLGFVKDSKWIDMDGDKDEDLVIAGEWMPITIIINEGGKLTPMALPNSGLEESSGWWNVIDAADFDHDGDMDLIAGNLGLNSKLHTSKSQPVTMYVKDFDNNGTIEQVLSHYVKGVEIPFYTRDEMTKQMPGLKKKYLSYSKFAEATLEDVLGKEGLATADRYIANTFESSYVENLGNGKFNRHSLGSAAQFSTVAATLIGDFNLDGEEDVLVAGNFFPINVQMGRNDASYGLLLKGSGKGSFEALPPYQSGFSVKGEVRQLKGIRIKGEEYYLALRNNSTIGMFALKKQMK